MSDESSNINTQGGAVFKGHVNAQGDVIGRDQIVITDDKSHDVHGLESPYLGLNAFTYDERGRYAGREAEVADAISALIELGAQRTLYFITGASGSGKSSFAQAGLLPALESYYAKRGQTLRILPIVRPGDNPEARIADALSDIKASSLGELNRAQANPAVLALDQFEEFFTQSPPDQRARIFAQLEALPPFAQSRLHIITTLRSDYLNELYARKKLWRICKQGAELRAMSEDALREAIQRPLQARAEADGRYAGKRFERELVHLLAEQTAPDPALLPLLQVTLDELWRNTGVLRLSSYRADGQLTDALKRRADDVLAWQDFDAPAPKQPRSKEGQAEMLETLLDLVKVSLDDDSRRNVRVSRRMDTLSASRQKLAQELASARLVSICDDNVNIIHESLINNWDKLREAVKEQREILQRRVRFEQDLADWVVNGKKDDFLLKDLALARAKELERVNDVALNTPEGRELLRASQDTSQAQQRRAQRRSRLVIAGLSVLTALALAMSGFAFVAKNEADQRARVARSQVLGSQGVKLTETQPYLSNLLGVEAYHQAPTSLAQQSLSMGLNNSYEIMLNLHHDGPVLEARWITNATWNKDESQILSWSSDGTAYVWDAETGRQILKIKLDKAVYGASWNNSESQILTWGGDNIARVWDVKSGSLLFSYVHKNQVAMAKWSRDESQIFTWSNDYVVRIWDVRSNLLLNSFQLNNLERNIRWSSDEKHVLSIGNDNAVHIWNSKDGALLFTLKHDNSSNGILEAIWNKDDSQIISWGGDKTTRIWDVKTGREIVTLRHSDSVRGANWNKDESRILSWSEDHTARIWDANTGVEIASFTHLSSLNGAIWNKDESHILTWSNDKTVRIWDVKTMTALKTFELEDFVIGAKWNTDESQIISWSWEKPMRLWDAKTGKLISILQNKGTAYGALWNKDESQILAWGGDNTVRVWNTRSGLSLLPAFVEKPIRGAKWNKDESQLMTWNYTYLVQIWDTKTGRLLNTFRLLSQPINAMWNKTETKILTLSFDETIRIWDLNSGQPLSAFHLESGISDVNWSNDEAQIRGLSQDAIHVWDAKTGEQLRLLSFENSVTSIRWSKNESRLLTWSFGDYSVNIWDTRVLTKTLALTLDNMILGASWGNDESKILTWSKDNSVRMWNALSGSQLLSFQQDNQIGTAVENQDGTLILTRDSENILQVWSIKSGELLEKLDGDGSPIVSAGWHTDQKRIWFVTANGILGESYVEIDDLAREACKRVYRNFTWQEWQTYFPGEKYRITCPNLPAHESVPKDQISG